MRVVIKMSSTSSTIASNILRKNFPNNLNHEMILSNSHSQHNVSSSNNILTAVRTCLPSGRMTVFLLFQNVFISIMFKKKIPVYTGMTLSFIIYNSTFIIYYAFLTFLYTAYPIREITSTIAAVSTGPVAGVTGMGFDGFVGWTGVVGVSAGVSGLQIY